MAISSSTSTGNGELDVYEDWRQDAETRAADLVSQMTVREKIAQMQHPTYLPRADGKIAPYLKNYCSEYGIGMLLIRELNSVEAAATTMNTIQEYAESSRLGVPVLVSMDSVHGLSYVSGATVTPHNLALAATRDEALVTKLAEIARDEHLAVGVRMTLSPEADIASEPRWGRVMETFGEDPDLVTQMVTAQVVAFQNGRDGLNTGSIVACMKHFPGAGPQMEGKDTSPIISSEETPVNSPEALLCSPGSECGFHYALLLRAAGTGYGKFRHRFQSHLAGFAAG